MAVPSKDAVTTLEPSGLKAALQTLPLMPAEFTPQQLWTRAFAESYRTELRAERITRPFELYQVNAGRYEQLTAAVLGGAGGATMDATMSRSEPGVIRHEVMSRSSNELGHVQSPVNGFSASHSSVSRCM